MIYILLILIFILLLAFFIYKAKGGDQHAQHALKFSSVIAVLFLLIRATPALFVNTLMLLPMVIPLLQNKTILGTKQKDANHSRGMSKEEASQILGVTPDTSPKEIMSAFKRLMLKNHPDQGGSRYIAEKLIKAKDALLDKK